MSRGVCGLGRRPGLGPSCFRGRLSLSSGRGLCGLCGRPGLGPGREEGPLGRGSRRLSGCKGPRTGGLSGGETGSHQGLVGTFAPERGVPGGDAACLLGRLECRRLEDVLTLGCQGLGELGR